MNNSRMIRVNEEILKESSQIIRGEIKDPRVTSMVTVTRVDTTNDLKYCKIYVSVLGDDKSKSDAIEGLTNASGYIRKRLATSINLRSTPSVKFILDDSMEYSMKISKLIKEANNRE